MSGSPPGPQAERVRLFVALELPEEIRDALVGWRESTVASEPALRAVARESLHATLCFLGWRQAGEVDPIRRACSAVAGLPAPRLSLGDPVWLPSRRPRVLAVELGDLQGRLAGLQAALSRELAAGGWYEPERRAYLGHVTVARARRGGSSRPRRLDPPPGLSFTAHRVTLYRSRLEAGAARYEALAAVDLGGE